ncbi:ABC transporter substrate-binding protein [Mesobacterium pallidum]|uniref:ABC transporter substrate-binding protein n=1 Tax=Mesobacterium pallidum TaxID=2872037 RepID=UPI001EE303FE|nr:ABC transporter substrate-binding protein [Mesobacterium pallidum]
MTYHRHVLGISVSAGLMLSSALPSLAQEASLRLVAPASAVGDALQQLADAYAAAHDGVRFTVQKFPSGDNYGQAVITQIQSGSAPDLIYTNAGYGSLESLMPLGQAGHLADLSGGAWVANFPDSAHDVYYDGDNLYGLPLSLTSVGLIHNTAMLEKLGIAYPETEEDFFAACAAAAEQGASFSAASGAFPYYIVETIAASKVYTETPDWNAKRRDGEVTFAETPGWTATFETFKRMADEGCFQRGFEAASVPDLFAAMAGELAASNVGPVTLGGAVLRMNPSLSLEIGPWPAGDQTVALGFYNDALSVAATSQHLDVALDFVGWLAEPEQQRAFNGITGGVSPVDVTEGTYPAMIARLAPYYSAGEIVGLPHTGWTKLEVRDALNRGATQIVTGQATIPDVLAAMDAAWGAAE